MLKTLIKKNKRARLKLWNVEDELKDIGRSIAVELLNYFYDYFMDEKKMDFRITSYRRISDVITDEYYSLFYGYLFDDDKARYSLDIRLYREHMGIKYDYLINMRFYSHLDVIEVKIPLYQIDVKKAISDSFKSIHDLVLSNARKHNYYFKSGYEEEYKKVNKTDLLEIY